MDAMTITQRNNQIYYYNYELMFCITLLINTVTFLDFFTALLITKYKKKPSLIRVLYSVQSHVYIFTQLFSSFPSGQINTSTV